MVVMNDEVHAAKYVTKTHTTNVSTFQTPTHGPLGLVMKKKFFSSKQLNPVCVLICKKSRELSPIISAYAGMKTELLDLLDVQQMDG